jgi:hypothetical protein
MSVELVRALSQQLVTERAEIDYLDRYYSGQQPLAFLDPKIRAATQGRLTSLVMNWPRIIVKAVVERLRVEGFRLAGEERPLEELHALWQASNMDRQSSLAHIDVLVHGRCFGMVWTGPTAPRLSMESAREVTATFDPETGLIREALKAFELDGTGRPQRANLYLSDRVEKYRQANGGWQLVETLPHDLGRPPVVLFSNEGRLGQPGGESDLADVIPVADAVNKLATDMMVSAEYHAMPRRWITGMQVAPAGTPEHERDREIMRQYLTEAEAGRYNSLPPGTNTGQYTEASLDNFVGAIRMLTEHLAALGKMPPHALGINTANPASADAIRSSEAGLVRRTEFKQPSLGESYEDLMRLAVLVRDGVVPESMNSLETIWASAETPTVAQLMDAALKGTQGQIITRRQAREDLGYTQVQIARMEAEDARAALGTVRVQIDEARRLQQEDGLSQQAAFAAVGLLQAASAIGQQPA